MRHVILLVSISVSLLASAHVARAADSRQRYVVLFAPGESRDRADAAINAAGGSLSDWFDGLGIAIATSDDPGFVGGARHMAGVVDVDLEPAFVQTDDADEAALAANSIAGPTLADNLYAQQWHIRRVRADVAWATTTGSHQTVVAVIDTGIAVDHPDLAPNVVFATCIAVTPGCDLYPALAHATRVSGTIAAVFGGGRTVGVGPDLGLASYKAVDPDGLFYAGPVFRSLLDAADRGFRVVNLSVVGWEDHAHARGLGSAVLTASNRVIDEVTRRGTLVVVAAGNTWSSLNGQIAGWLTMPQAVAVSATGIRPEPTYPQDGAYDVFAYYSTYGADIDISAPGGDCGPGIWAVKDGPGCAQEYRLMQPLISLNPSCAAAQSCPFGYGRNTGTSFAAPLVAAAAALVFDVNPDLTPQQVKAILLRTAQPLGDRQLFGHGMLDVAAAVEEAARMQRK